MKKTFRIMVLAISVVFAMVASVYAEGAQYYVSGDFNGYTNPDENFQMKLIGNGTYSVTKKIPAGDHIYKITNGTWNADGCWGRDSYANPKPAMVDDGPFRNILFKTEKEQEITFYFNENTKKVADSTFYTLLNPYIVGDFFSELGIGNDWDASKATMLLTDPEFDNVYTGTFKLPAGKYSFKVAMDKSWNISYGINGATSGMDTGIPLELAVESDVTFTFDGKTHITTVNSPGIAPAKTDEKAKTEEKAAAAAGTSTVPENPKTGDAGMLMPVLGLVAAAAGIVCFKKRQRG